MYVLNLITIHLLLPKEKEEFLDSDTVINQLSIGPHSAIGSGYPREQRFAVHVEDGVRVRNRRLVAVGIRPNSGLVGVLRRPAHSHHILPTKILK